ncbi:MAG: hypothetical protein WC770_06555 [Phycisphaerae bacterium]|jgi:hypothetical protein
MSAKKIVSVALMVVVLFVLAGWKSKTSTQMKLNLSPQSETTYRAVAELGKDYSFFQPSVNKTKEQHTVGRVEMVFVQKVESVSSKGIAAAIITIKELKYITDSQKDAGSNFDSTSENAKSDPMFALIGQSYKISIDPNGAVAVLDAKAVRSAIASGFAKKFADKIFSDEEIKNRHQVLALMNADKAGKNGNKMASKKGDKWVAVSSSPQGMLKPKTFEKTYTITGIKLQGKEQIATVTMDAAPSSKGAEIPTKEEAGMGFFANMFDETDSYTGKMVINLTTGQIISYTESLKAEWVAVEPAEEQKSDKGPDRLIMGFKSLYSIEKVK